MKPGLLILPFLALLIAAVGTAVGSAIPEAKWVAQIAWAIGAGIVALWVMLDLEGFKAMFRRKGAKYGASSGLVVLLGGVVIVGVAVVAARPRFNKSYDVTRDRLNTLSDQSLKVIETLKTSAADKPLTVTAYMTDEKVQGEFRDLVTLYQSMGATFAVEWVDPQANPTRAIADKVTEGNTVVFRRGDQEKRLTTFNEEKITNALVNVLKDKTKKIYFVKGHGEGELKGSEPASFSAVVQDLENNKNGVEELSLLEAAKVPTDADMVVIGGPKYDLKEEEARILEDYLKRGGSVLAMVPAMTRLENLGKLLEKFGVRLGTDLLLLDAQDPRAQMIGQNNALVTEFDEFSAVTKDFSRSSSVALIMPNTRSLEEVADNPNKLKVTLAAKTAGEIMRVKGVSSRDDLANVTEERVENGAFPVMAVAVGKAQAPATASNEKSDKSGDPKSDAPSAAGASGARETRLVVVGSVDFANNAGAQMAQHRDMFMNITNFLLQDEDFIAIRPKDPTKSTINIATGKSQLILVLLSFIYPVSFLATGTFFWIKRRRA